MNINFRNINIHRSDVKQPESRSRVEKYLELALKCFILFVVPIIPTLLFAKAWHHWFYEKGISFDGQMEVIITSGVIPMFGVIYALIASHTLAVVFAEHKEMKAAVKRGILGVIDFVRIRDERVSALIYAVIYLLSAVILAAFASIKYPYAIGGLCIVPVVFYLLLLIAIIIKEADNPCGGLFFIRRISRLWLNIDTEKFRAALDRLNVSQHTDKKLLMEIVENSQIEEG